MRSLEAFLIKIKDFFTEEFSKEEVKIYFPGVAIEKGGYEVELDEIINCLINIKNVKKTGIILFDKVREERADIDIIVGNLFEIKYNGILFIPRITKWRINEILPNNSNSIYSNKYHSILYSIRKLLSNIQSGGLWLYKINEDFSVPQESYYLTDRLIKGTDAIVNRIYFKSKKEEHILMKCPLPYCN